jgi:hypothetical protein
MPISKRSSEDELFPKNFSKIFHASRFLVNSQQIVYLYS